MQVQLRRPSGSGEKAGFLALLHAGPALVGITVAVGKGLHLAGRPLL
jgi:hypothetical protein